MKFITLLPTSYNDGSSVSEETFKAITRELALQFGGCTIAGDAQGAWVHENQLYRDETRIVVCHCDNSRYDEAKAAVIKIGKTLKQIEMYFEVQEMDGTENLKVE